MANKDRIELSLMGCYAGKQAIEVMGGDPDINDYQEPFVYLQMVEGCSYNVWRLTPEECDKVADLLKEHAVAIRAEYVAVTVADREKALKMWRNALPEIRDPEQRQDALGTIKNLERLIKAQSAQA